MALDNYRIRENKNVEVIAKKSYDEMKKDLDGMIDSLPTEDIDQKWIKENEIKENKFNQQQSNEEEQNIDAILNNFRNLRNKNNEIRKQYRTQQLESVLGEMDMASISRSF